MILLTGGTFAAWAAMARQPGRYRDLFRESTWVSAMRWTVVLLAAAGLGSVVAGGTDVLRLAMAAGCVILGLEAIMWTRARAFGNRDNRDG